MSVTWSSENVKIYIMLVVSIILFANLQIPTWSRADWKSAILSASWLPMTSLSRRSRSFSRFSDSTSLLNCITTSLSSCCDVTTWFRSASTHKWRISSLYLSTSDWCLSCCKANWRLNLKIFWTYLKYFYLSILKLIAKHLNS